MKIYIKSGQVITCEFFEEAQEEAVKIVEEFRRYIKSPIHYTAIELVDIKQKYYIIHPESISHIELEVEQ